MCRAPALADFEVVERAGDDLGRVDSILQFLPAGIHQAVLALDLCFSLCVSRACANAYAIFSVAVVPIENLVLISGLMNFVEAL